MPTFSFIVGVPAAPGAPTITVLSATEVSVALPSEPLSPTPIIAWHLEWTQDGGTEWIEVNGIVNGQVISELTPETEIQVRVWAENETGDGPPGLPDTDTTAAVENPAVAPSAPAANQWSVGDAGNGTEGVLTILANPDDGGATITDFEVELDDSDTWDSLGATGPGAYPFDASIGAHTVKLRAVNSVDPGAESAAKNLTIADPNAEGVSNQTAEFGALTAAGSGGFRPLDSNGNLVSLVSYDSLVSGSLGGYTPSISSGLLIFNAQGCPDGAVLRCGLLGGGTVDITISSVANRYDVANATEFYNQIGSMAAGRTCKLRPEYFLGRTTRLLKGKNWTSNRATIEGTGSWAKVHVEDFEGDGEFTAYTGQGAYTQFDQGIRFQQVRGLDVKDIAFENTTGGDIPVSVFGVCTGGAPNDINFDRCMFSELPFDVATVDSSVSRNMCFRTVTDGSGDDLYKGQITRCLFQYGNDCTVWTTNEVLVSGCVWRYILRDGFKGSYRNGGTKRWEYNVAYDPCDVTSAHGDFFMQQAANNGQETSGMEWVGNVVFHTGLPADRNRSQVINATSDPQPSAIWADPLFVGNFLMAGGSHHFTSISGFTGNGAGVRVANNVLVFCPANLQANNGVPPRVSGPFSSGTFVYKGNITEGSPTSTPTTSSNNVVLGIEGSTLAYTTEFDYDNTVYLQSLAHAKLRFNSKNPTRGVFGATNITIGTVLNPSGWSVDTSALLSA